jgi:hypothetical protein
MWKRTASRLQALSETPADTRVDNMSTSGAMDDDALDAVLNSPITKTVQDFYKGMTAVSK